MKIIDCDSHIIPPEIFDFVPDNLKQDLPKLFFDKDGRLFDIQYAKDPIINKTDSKPDTLHCDLYGLTNILERFKDLAKMKVDMQLLAPQERAMRFNYSTEKNLGAAMAHSYNIVVKNIVDQYPDRFFGVALLPFQDMDMALLELQWAIDNNFKVAYLHYTVYDPTTKGDVPWSVIDRMEEFYDMCEKNDIVIFTHFSMQHDIAYSLPERIKLIANNKPVGRLEMGVYDLLSDNIFDRHPKLQIILTEGAQLMIGKILKNIAESYTRDPSLYKCKNHPFSYIKENIYFTIDIEMKPSFNVLMEYVGPKRLLFSTDYPHHDPSGLNKWKDTSDLYASGLSQQDIENIAFRNAEKLFKLS